MVLRGVLLQALLGCILRVMSSHSPSTDRRPAPPGQYAARLPNRDDGGRSPSPTLHDDSHSHFRKRSLVTPSFSVPSNPIEQLAGEHPGGLDDDDLAILVLDEILVSEVVQPLGVVTHAVLWDPSSDHFPSRRLLETSSHNGVGVFFDHFVLLRYALWVHDIVSILKAEEFAMTLLHRVILGKPTPSLGLRILRIDTVPPALIEALYPPFNDFLRSIHASVVVYRNLLLKGASNHPLLVFPERKCFRFP